MDEIALLQQQLAAVQQQESALKLSDHNVIDLLLKLQQLGKVQLVHTLSGTQFLTPAQIEREVADHVTLNAGRMSLSELQRLINVDRAYIDKYVAQLAKNSHAAARKSGGGSSSSSSTSIYYVINLGEEVVTNWYLDAIMEDTNTLLKDSGTLTVGELAQQYGFAVDYMKEVVQARIGSVLRAQERGNVLYTDSYVAGQKAQIRGVFAATTRPTFVPDIVRAYGFEDEIVDECLAEMLQSGVLMGALRGREYVPYVFMEAQRESMYSFFQQNGYLEHSRAAKLQVARPFDFLKKRFPDAVPLDKAVVSAALQLQVEGSIEAAVTEGSFLDVTTVVPSAISPSDVALLLRKSALLEQDKTAHAIRDVYVVSSAFIDDCVAKMTEDAAQKATKAAAEQQLKHSSSKNSVASTADAGDNHFSDEEDAGGKRGAKGKGKRAGKASKQTGAPPEEPASSGKAKGGAKGKRGKRGGNDDAPAQSKRKADKSSASSSAAISIVPTREELAALLVDWFPQLEDFQDDDEFMDGLAEHLEAEADRLYSAALAAALSSILRGDAASLRDLRKKFEDRFDDLLSPLLVLEKGFNKLSMHVDAKDEPGMAQLKVVEAHVLDTAGTELAALVTSFVAEANSLKLDGVPPFSSPTIVENHVGDQPEPAPVLTALSEENKRVLEKNLSASTATAVVRMWTLATAGRRSLGDLMVHVPVLADALSMPLRKFDRKKERQVVFANRHTLVEQLDRHLERGDAVAATSIALQLLFQQCTGLPARFPTDHVTYAPTVLKTLVASVPPEAMTQFQRLVDLADATPATPEEEQARAQLLQDVRALVTMKDIGAAS